MKRKTVKLTDAEKIKKILEEVDTAYKDIRSDIENHELEVYLDGTDIRGNMVEDSEDIEPREVAMLGAYTTITLLRKELKKIATGKEEKDEVLGAIAISLDKDGNVQHQTFGNIPSDAMKQLRKALDSKDLKKLIGEDDGEK